MALVRPLLAFIVLGGLSACVTTPEPRTVAADATVAQYTATQYGATAQSFSPKGRGGTAGSSGHWGGPLAASLGGAETYGEAEGQTNLASLSRLPVSRTPLPTRPRPAILSNGRRLECVPYARKLSQIALRGNAWTWWNKAKGQYRRGAEPAAGSVIVLSKTRRLRYGHLAYVAAVLNEREILVHQANWLNRGRIHRYTPVRDVSKNNDWSVVQVWYTPGQRYGSGRYPTYGFIYPTPKEEGDLLQASN